MKIIRKPIREYVKEMTNRQVSQGLQLEEIEDKLELLTRKTKLDYPQTLLGICWLLLIIGVPMAWFDWRMGGGLITLAGFFFALVLLWAWWRE